MTKTFKKILGPIDNSANSKRVLSNAIALAKLLVDKGEVIPIANIHKKDAEPIKNLLSGYANINTKGINSEKVGNNFSRGLS